MKNLLYTTLFILSVSISGTSFSQIDTLTFNGHYFGKDVYISNPQLESPSSFCIQQIYLNGELIKTPKLAVIHVKLEQLEEGAAVNLIITHKQGCLPYLLDKTCIFSSDNKQREGNKMENCNFYLMKSSTFQPCIKR